DLPPELIAQTPLADRSASRLLVLDRQSGDVTHRSFKEIIDFLVPGDCLVINDTRVLPARIFGKRDDTGAVVEFVLLKAIGNNRWEAIAGPGKKATAGRRFSFSDKLTAKVAAVLDDGNRVLDFECDGNFYEVLDEIGQMPLPPYITEKLADRERYQTVYSRELGSAAAPTAGLHFTNELLNQISEMGVKICRVTLHVGLGTFRPVKTERIEDHHMHSEWYHIPAESARILNETRASGRRIICVGTTSCRTVESAAGEDGMFRECSGETSIFIYPGYKFKVMDGLITNFHLPESTLIMLVSAFAGYEHTMSAYREAVARKYRFFSFGDAMLIL
ncbi:MAG: tRNA preQ1(34) S-adenosylmethionine ribosyltransferase-isomerase QueA, partial [Clostridia bacterium]|nr:tRNA preQ1(34) S-adenosylmethionine ribosyltransferase-isomerase QueA [Clostridia bacterium]